MYIHVRTQLFYTHTYIHVRTHTHTHTHTHHCTGTADMMSVGCVYIGNSSSQEISQFTAADNSQPTSTSCKVDLLMNSIAYELYTELLEECNVVFDSVNPHTAAHKTVVIRNYRSAMSYIHVHMYMYLHVRTCTYYVYKHVFKYIHVGMWHPDVLCVYVCTCMYV